MGQVALCLIPAFLSSAVGWCAWGGDFLPAERVREILAFGEMRYSYGCPKGMDYVEYLEQIGANVSHGYGGVGGAVSWGFPDRATFDRECAEVRKEIARLHAKGILVITYISPILWYGDPQTRSGVLDFYDKRWKDYADFLGPRPDDPMTWVQVRADGAPQPYEYKGQRGFYWCPNHPAVRQYVQGAVKMDVANGADGVFYDGPAFYPPTCYCQWCRKLFQEQCRKAGVDFELKQGHAVPGDGPVLVEWNKFRTASLTRFMCETRAFARNLNPNFVLTVNYNMGGDPYRVLSACGEDPVAYREAQDILFNETAPKSSPHWREGQRVSNTPALQFLRAAAKRQPVVLTNYLVEAAKPEAYTNLTRLAMAEGLANGVYAAPWFPHHPDPAVVEAYSRFMVENREVLVGSGPASDVGLLCLLQPAYAGLRSGAMPVSRMLMDMGATHDVILDDDLVRECDKDEAAGGLRKYRLVIVPPTPALGDAQIGALRSYFAGGGSLVVMGNCGMLDECGRPRPDGLMRLVGTAVTSTEVFRGESGGCRMAYIPEARLPKLPPHGREAVPGDVDEIEKAIRWAAHDLLPTRHPFPRHVEVHLAERKAKTGRMLLAHVVNYQVDSEGKVTVIKDLDIKVLVPKGYRVTGVRLLSQPDAPKADIETAGDRSYLAVRLARLSIYEVIAIDLRR